MFIHRAFTNRLSRLVNLNYFYLTEDSGFGAVYILYVLTQVLATPPPPEGRCQPAADPLRRRELFVFFQNLSEVKSVYWFYYMVCALFSLSTNNFFFYRKSCSYRHQVWFLVENVILFTCWVSNFQIFIVIFLIIGETGNYR